MNKVNRKQVKVKPISVDSVHVKIKCPYCRKVHFHGSCGGKNYEGSRVAHCKDMPNKEYYIIEVENE